MKILRNQAVKYTVAAAVMILSAIGMFTLPSILDVMCAVLYLATCSYILLSSRPSTTIIIKYSDDHRNADNEG